MIALARATSAATVGKTRQIRAVPSSEAVSTRVPDGSDTALMTAQHREFSPGGSIP
jgi:hypothetical protein